MKVFGLTGGMGMGKSTSAQILRDHSVPVIDTDDLARQAVEPGEPALAEIRRVFGEGMIMSDGHLRRDALAERVFSNPTALRQLENILHPRIREMWRARLAAWEAKALRLAVVVVPLLFETNSQIGMHATVCVACTGPTQRRRLLARDWPPTQIDQRLASQWPVDRKIAMGDYVVWTEGTLEAHAEQLRRIFQLAPPTQ